MTSLASIGFRKKSEQSVTEKPVTEWLIELKPPKIYADPMRAFFRLQRSRQFPDHPGSELVLPPGCPTVSKEHENHKKRKLLGKKRKELKLKSTGN